MHNTVAYLEMVRWGYCNVPGVLFYYGQELELEIDDIGVVAAIFYAYSRSKPLYQIGIKAGQVLQSCPVLTKQKLARKLSRLAKLNIIAFEESSLGFMERQINIDPLLEKLNSLISRDHNKINLTETQKPTENDYEQLAQQYRIRIEQLELALSETNEITRFQDQNIKRVADFISQKTGRLISSSMSNELKKWLTQMNFTPEFMVCVLELCFERNIYTPHEISYIVKDLKECAINSVEGMQTYFKRYVDTDKNVVHINSRFDPDMAEFGKFTGIDMTAEARKKVYNKWRYDWSFSHAMIMKAGAVMCQRTKNGGLEYIDSVLQDWLSKEIRRPEDVDKALKEFKTRNKAAKAMVSSKKNEADNSAQEYEIFVPPAIRTEIKKKEFKADEDNVVKIKS